MSRTASITLVVAASAAAGVAIWLLTDSTTASYIVGVAGTAFGIAALVVTGDGGKDTQPPSSADRGDVSIGGDVTAKSGGIAAGRDAIVGRDAPSEPHEGD